MDYLILRPIPDGASKGNPKCRHWKNCKEAITGRIFSSLSGKTKLLHSMEIFLLFCGFVCLFCQLRASSQSTGFILSRLTAITYLFIYFFIQKIKIRCSLLTPSIKAAGSFGKSNQNIPPTLLEFCYLFWILPCKYVITYKRGLIWRWNIM
jgi:hypothetical protein